MASNRAQRLEKARAKKKAAKASGMANPGGATRYALKRSGEVQPDYRLEGGMLLEPAYLAHLGMPGPHIVSLAGECA